MLEKKNLTAFIKYFSFVVTLILVSIVFIDSTLNIGIMKLWDSSSKSYAPMISMLSDAQRTALIALSIVVLITLLFLVFYLKKKKMSDIALAMFAGTLVIYILGSVQGKIVPPRGKNGFGFDSVFLPDGCSKTYGEMTREEKDMMSHRRKALDALYHFLMEKKEGSK